MSGILSFWFFFQLNIEFAETHYTIVDKYVKGTKTENLGQISVRL